MSTWRARMKSRRDPNEPEIIDALRAVGAAVYQLEGLGVPDLVAFWRSSTTFLEVKSPPGPRGGTSGKGRRRRESQEQFIAVAESRGVKVWVVTKVSEALRAIGAALPVEEG